LATGSPIRAGHPGDKFFTSETFSLNERWFNAGWLRRFKGTSSVVFHDAIPHFQPETTWPKSVRRFPGWFRGLTNYNKVFFVSKRSRRDAQEVCQQFRMASLDGPVLSLGSDYLEELPVRVESGEVVLLHVGIIEPRKGQDVLLEACERLWRSGLSFKLVLLGRVNPRFGKGIVDRIRSLQEAGRNLVHESSADDARLAHWHARASVAVSPSRAEGFGLPVLESLWTGCPVITSDQPCLEVLSSMNGVRLIEEVSTDAIEKALQPILQDASLLKSLAAEAAGTVLPTWSDTARQLCQELE
jgi:glycosyltransferase involved in cell wall biosynthesis